MEDKDYIQRRDHLVSMMKRQNLSWEYGCDDEPKSNNAKRGRKPTKPNKYIETKPNNKTYASKSKFG